ncbi:MAG: thiamine pyrophosphate-binding protein [Pseudomonadota bacterium]
MSQTITISDALLAALSDNRINHIFGIPGDYVLGLFDALTNSEINVVNTCDEQSAGFAADAYARLNGLGAVCVTYGVGGLKLINSTAQAYAERAPVIVISGAPGVEEQSSDALLHHRVRDFGSQLRIFREVTCAQAVLDNPATAAGEIHRVIAEAKNTKRPAYIEVPRDCLNWRTPNVLPATDVPRYYDEATLAEALEEILTLLEAAKNPVILAGVEIHRFGLQSQLEKIVRQTAIPFATTILGKSLLNEKTPGFLGVYSGALSEPNVKAGVENSDCVLMLGAMLTDLNTGIFTAELDPARVISISADRVAVHRHVFPRLSLALMLNKLASVEINQQSWSNTPPVRITPKAFKPKPKEPISVSRLFECLNTHLDQNTAVVADPGDALFAATDLTIHDGAEFLACAYYASLGFAVPAALGMQLARPDRRPIVLVGDGAFQMTGMELSTALRYRLNPIVIVLDNEGYGTERPMLDGPFNDVHPWSVSNLPQIIGGGIGMKIHSEEDFHKVLIAAKSDLETLHILHVKLEKDDISPALARLTANLKSRV